MSLNGIVAGDYGQPLILTVIDLDTDAAADVSAYTTSQQMQFKDPAGSTTTVTAAFVGDGSDGEVSYTPTDGAGVHDESGQWKVRVVLMATSAKLTTEWLAYYVL